MVKRTPTILACSTDFERGTRAFIPGGNLDHALKLAEGGPSPKLCFLPTALGDQRHFIAELYNAFIGTSVQVSHVQLFPMPNVPDMRKHLLAQDVIWVLGGSVAGLLAMWRLHGLDEILYEVWQAGVVLGGASAGSICWHIGGATDSFGPELQPFTDGLGFLPYGNGVHFDSAETRRPSTHQMVRDGLFAAAFATDDNVGLVYRGPEMVEAVTRVPDKWAYRIWRDDAGDVHEDRIKPRLLTSPAG